MPARIPRIAIAGCLLLVLAACGGSGVKAPVGTRGDPEQVARGYHVVRPGESLYSIAWQYGRDYQDLARWNGIRAPYTIHAGQRLRLTAARSSPQKAKQKQERTVRKEIKLESDSKTAAASAPTPARIDTGPVETWKWPARGPIVRRFDSNSPGKKGIGIGGERGTEIHAAAPGRVVYSGSGLVGYGRLIIVKHNDNYLSAYGHNDKLLVQEGQTVTAGQTIAYMGSSGTHRTMLHFEIRLDGNPVDPMRFLP